MARPARRWRNPSSPTDHEFSEAIDGGMQGEIPEIYLESGRILDFNA